MSNLEVELEIVLPQMVAFTSGLPDKQEFMKSGNIEEIYLGVNSDTFDSGRSLVTGESKP